MEKLDITIAVGGAVILVVATVAASLEGASTAIYDVTVHFEAKAGPQVTLPIAAGGGRANASLAILDANVSRVNVVVFANTTVFPSGATLHVTLTSPQGVKTENDGTTGTGAAVSHLSVAVDAPGAPAPASRQVRATDADEAVRTVASSPIGGPAGNWTLDISYAPGGPVPPTDVTITALPSWTVWNATAQLSPAPSR